jgi:hypothetical protein
VMSQFRSKNLSGDRCRPSPTHCFVLLCIRPDDESDLGLGRRGGVGSAAAVEMEKKVVAEPRGV